MHREWAKALGKHSETQATSSVLIQNSIEEDFNAIVSLRTRFWNEFESICDLSDRVEAPLILLIIESLIRKFAQFSTSSECLVCSALNVDPQSRFEIHIMDLSLVRYDAAFALGECSTFFLKND